MTSDNPQTLGEHILETGRQTLVEVPSGTIDIVHTTAGPTLQFNCSCEDALPYCRGMCCGMRHLYNTNLTEEESKEFKSFTHPKRPGEFFLAFDVRDQKCVYQDRDYGTCNLHFTKKPAQCVNWHCSPGGVGDGIVKRDRGWFMLPMMMATETK